MEMVTNVMGAVTMVVLIANPFSGIVRWLGL